MERVTHAPKGEFVLLHNGVARTLEVITARVRKG